MNVFLLSGRGVLHKAVRTDQGLLTDERCQKDQMRSRTVYEDEATAARDAKRHCRRCFRDGGR